jgi:membrane protein implicated in regulation of membrane protease activity
MTNTPNRKIVYIVPRTWIGRLVAAMSTIMLVILAVFFFTIFFIIISVLAVVIIARILWYQRQTSRKGPEDIIEGEYTVEDAKTHRPSQIPSSDSQCLKDNGNEVNL